MNKVALTRYELGVINRKSTRYLGGGNRTL